MRLILPLLFGLGGFAMLMGLGLWQLDRLGWKEDVLAEIEGRIVAPPVALPPKPMLDADRYLPVRVTGEVTGAPLRVLASAKGFGPGFRLIYPYRTEGGRAVMVDFGMIRSENEAPDLTARLIDVTGNLHWPDEVDSFTPDPDPGARMWFARDVPAMAADLGTEPTLIVLRGSEPNILEIRPFPVSTEGIPNSHLGYAIQWFGLAAVWLGMTGFLLWRIRRRTL